jgi:hypothetical protein
MPPLASVVGMMVRFPATIISTTTGPNYLLREHE